MTARWRALGLAVAALGLTAGATACVTARTTENLLGQAGFRRLPADAPNKVVHLETLPDRRLVGRVNPQGKQYYVYSDPTGCHCLYIGNAQQYETYRRLLQEYRMAQSAAVQEAREWEIQNSGLE